MFGQIVAYIAYIERPRIVRGLGMEVLLYVKRFPSFLVSVGIF